MKRTKRNVIVRSTGERQESSMHVMASGHQQCIRILVHFEKQWYNGSQNTSHNSKHIKLKI